MSMAPSSRVQHVFDDSGFGVQANATVVGTNKPYNPLDLSISGFAVTGLANSANLVAFYDKDGFQARIAATWQDVYLVQVRPGAEQFRVRLRADLHQWQHARSTSAPAMTSRRS